MDIDIKSEISPEDEALTKIPGEEPKSNGTSAAPVPPSQNEAEAPKSESSVSSEQQTPSSPVAPSPGKHAALATPAVRHLIKELNLTITDVQGTGKDGRVLKEDVQRHAAAQKEESASLSASASAFIPKATAEDKTLSLTPIQTQMFKTMTRSLSIPHFLYSEAVDFSTLNRARKRVNTIAAANNGNGNAPTTKLSALPFVIKAVSLALQQYPILNSLLDTSTAKPQIFQKGTQNIGIAIDTPSGLIVPVIRSVESHSIASLAAEIQRLSQLARANKLSPADLSDATFTISNIGSIGGGAVAPVIVPPQVAILAVGKAKVVPAFDEDGELVRREECVLSWSADHRVVDGATVARCAELVKTYLEDVESMLVNLR